MVEAPVERIGSSLRPAAATLDELPEAILEWVEARREALASGRAAGVAPQTPDPPEPPGAAATPPGPDKEPQTNLDDEP